MCLLLKKPVCVSNTGMSYDSSVSDRARKNAKFEYLDYQIPVTQFKGPKGNGDMEAARRDCNAPPTRDLNICLCGRQTGSSVMGVRVGVANFFWVHR